MKFLTPTSPEWPSMWEALADATGDYADCCPETGECWQYMGTVLDPTFSTPTLVHQFRHRDRPAEAKTIGGFDCRGRFYLDLHAETLDLVRVTCHEYRDPDRIPAALTSAEAIKRARDEAQRIEYPDHVPFRESECGGAFDGFSVSSDADPGL